MTKSVYSHIRPNGTIMSNDTSFQHDNYFQMNPDEPIKKAIDPLKSQKISNFETLEGFKIAPYHEIFARDFRTQHSGVLRQRVSEKRALINTEDAQKSGITDQSVLKTSVNGKEVSLPYQISDDVARALTEPTMSPPETSMSRATSAW